MELVTGVERVTGIISGQNRIFHKKNSTLHRLFYFVPCIGYLSISREVCSKVCSNPMLQHPIEGGVYVVRRGRCITAQSVAVHAESVHVSGVAHKTLDFPGGQLLYHADEAVAQLINRDRWDSVGTAIDLPALIVIGLALEFEDAFPPAGDGPLLFQHGPRTI